MPSKLDDDAFFWSYIERALHDQLGLSLLLGSPGSMSIWTAIIVSGTGELLIDQRITMCRYNHHHKSFSGLRFLQINCDELTGKIALEAMKKAHSARMIDKR